MLDLLLQLSVANNEAHLKRVRLALQTCEAAGIREGVRRIALWARDPATNPLGGMFEKGSDELKLARLVEQALNKTWAERFASLTRDELCEVREELMKAFERREREDG